MSDYTHIAWIDVETNGIELDSDLLAVAMIITDMQFNEVSEPFEAVVRMTEHSAEVAYKRANDYVREMHTKTGLWDRLTNPETSRRKYMIETEMLDLLREVNVEPGTILFGGNVTRLDQNMLQRNLPAVYAHLDYQSFDISPVAIFAKTQYNVPWFDGYTGTHEALTDVREAITEAKYYVDALSDCLGDGHNIW